MKVVIVHGAPLSGKTTYVEKRIGPNDIQFDFDKIMQALTDQPAHIHNDNLIDYAIGIRTLIIAKLKSEENIDKAYIITTKVTEELERELIGLNPEYIEVKTNVTEAKARLHMNPDNRNIKEWEAAIDRYFLGKVNNSKFYSSYGWKNKRPNILKRDGYLCKECSRYGKVTAANTIHHIQPLEVRPDLRLNSDNLISLCQPCHEAMHNKFNSTLSKLGEQLKQRSIQKNPELRDTIR